ncbi:desmoglein-2.1-like isoform X2 [Betta splendens]|uniref:Desmoglein-2.1-like isoform X2 n=1 Tax=Betta splendens TaxID=158456 RepID=A0A9W2XRQ7_BETSP|nr:desmoglein-2.1-like isoform X2 [Betta splendens]
MAWISLAKMNLLLLLLALMLTAEAKQKRPQSFSRKKREWILPPAKLLENTDYTHKEFIAKIRSDKDKDAKVEYYLTGPGADKPPFNLFVVDHDTGFVRITNILDREKSPFFNLTGIAKYRDGTTAEDDIPLTITVLDQNDNAPYFELQTGNITEASKEVLFLMR